MELLLKLIEYVKTALNFHPDSLIAKVLLYLPHHSFVLFSGWVDGWAWVGAQTHLHLFYVTLYMLPDREFQISYCLAGKLTVTASERMIKQCAMLI